VRQNTDDCADVGVHLVLPLFRFQSRRRSSLTPFRGSSNTPLHTIPATEVHNDSRAPPTSAPLLTRAPSPGLVRRRRALGSHRGGSRSSSSVDVDADANVGVGVDLGAGAGVGVGAGVGAGVNGNTDAVATANADASRAAGRRLALSPPVPRRSRSEGSSKPRSGADGTGASASPLLAAAATAAAAAASTPGVKDGGGAKHSGRSRMLSKGERLLFGGKR